MTKVPKIKLLRPTPERTRALQKRKDHFSNMPQAQAEEVAEGICELILNGSTLQDALATHKIQYRWFWVMQNRFPEIKAMYHAAQEAKAHSLVDQILPIVDAPIPEGVDPRVELDQRKQKTDARWRWSGKWAKAQFGESSKLEVSNNTTINLKTVLDEAERYAIKTIEHEPDDK